MNEKKEDLKVHREFLENLYESSNANVREEFMHKLVVLLQEHGKIPEDIPLFIKLVQYSHEIWRESYIRGIDDLWEGLKAIGKENKII